jgi:hypothetical protein
MNATLLWARANRFLALNKLRRLQESAPFFEIRDGYKVNITEEEILRTRQRLAKTEELIRRIERRTNA